MKYLGSLLGILVLSSVCVASADEGERDKLIGSWVSAGGDAASGWTFEKNGDTFQIKSSVGSGAEAVYTCKADGQQCTIKIGGRKATVSMWFNGPKLVQMETQGSTIVKRRFAVQASGDTMELEIMPMSPSGKTETIQYKRAPVSSAHAK